VDETLVVEPEKNAKMISLMRAKTEHAYNLLSNLIVIAMIQRTATARTSLEIAPLKNKTYSFAEKLGCK
jgi:hypothetical protein